MSKRGFAALSAEERKKRASQGGKAAHAKGTAHTLSGEKARVAGRKGGKTVSKDREHMAKIGRKGGKAKRRPKLYCRHGDSPPCKTCLTIEREKAKEAKLQRRENSDVN
jgi:uncharacterized protein